MKKIIALSVAMFALSLWSADAQSLLDLLGGNSSPTTEKSQTSSTQSINLAALKGVWNYSGAAVEFTGTDLVAMLGSSVAAPTIKQSLESYYTRVGVVQGSCSIEFKANDVYTIRTASTSVEGLYAFNAQSQKVTVTCNHPELGGKKSLDGKLTFTGEKLMLTFEADKIVAIVQELTKDQALDQNVRDMIKMISEYKGLYLGFEMEK